MDGKHGAQTEPGGQEQEDLQAGQLTQNFLWQMWQAAGGAAAHLGALRWRGSGSLPSVFAVSDLAQAAVAAAGLALAELLQAAGLPATATAPVVADRRLASLWFDRAIAPQGWNIPAPRDAVTGDYATADGWIRLHTNAPHHRVAALAVLEIAEAAADKSVVAQAVKSWQGDALEAAIVKQGGCAAVMRSMAQWQQHPQGGAVSAEPLLHFSAAGVSTLPDWHINSARPLQGIRVLDLTRVLAGPTATRFLAAFGADVLRIDEPHWDEPALVPDMAAGKRCARLDLKSAAGQEVFRSLLAQADVLVHGLRPDALAALGLDADARRRLNPGLVDVCLDAYGWSGPWQQRRGFDSLVQMSSGIAEAGMHLLRRERPTPLPVQALDYATGYLLATAALRGLTQRLQSGRGSTARTSLARMGQLLVSASTTRYVQGFVPVQADDWAPAVEHTGWGPAQRLYGPVTLGAAATTFAWQQAAAPLGTAVPQWW